MHVGIVGCRGIPNRYGGFEQFATYLSENLVDRGVQVSVYCSHYHPIHERVWKGIQRISMYDPESFTGNAGQILYDLLCILDARQRKFDVILQLGYTSSGLWQWLLPRQSCVITNMDGLEWSRSKYNWFAKKFLIWSEKKVAERSDFLIADAVPIREYLNQKYNKNARWLSYAAEPVTNPGDDSLSNYELQKGAFNLVIARLQPDNHIEEIILGHLLSSQPLPLIIVGNTHSQFGRKMKEKYNSEKVVFLEGIFDKDILDQLRYHAHLYFHGHSAGGTNPSLLEAMAVQARIVAHKNVFNESILGQQALYFTNSQEICALLDTPQPIEIWKKKMEANLETIKTQYSTDQLLNEYYNYFNDCLTDFQQSNSSI